jgi:hypothetical protein
MDTTRNKKGQNPTFLFSIDANTFAITYCALLCLQTLKCCWSFSLVKLMHVGEFRKTRHPRNAKFDEVLETCFSGTGNSWFSKAWNLWNLGFAKREVRESWFGEEVGSRTCGSTEPRAGDRANFGGRPIRESVKGLVRESQVKTFTNRRRSKVKVVVPKVRV